MSMLALRHWREVRSPRLDRLSATRDLIERSPVRGAAREAARLADQSHVVWLTTEFQSFCRELHDECITNFIDALEVTGSGRKAAVAHLLARDRRLQLGNATWANVCRDFDRFPIRLSAGMRADYAGAFESWMRTLEHIHRVRNAIVHGDTRAYWEAMGREALSPQLVANWRSQLDEIVAAVCHIIEASEWGWDAGER